MKEVHILLVEDNEGDIVLTLEAFEESKILNKFSVVRNGKEALDFYSGNPRTRTPKNRTLSYWILTSRSKAALKYCRKLKMMNG